MKKMFKKAMTVLGSIALVGATVGVASAAAYPAPFDDGAVVVTGTGEGVSSSDSVAAGKILSGLQAHAAGKSTSTVKIDTSSGDVLQFDKSSNHFNLGDTITSVWTASIDEEYLEELLAKGTYEDDENDEFDYTQEITVGAHQLAMFTDSEYDDGDPTVGFRIASGANVLSYTLDFSSGPTISNMPDTDLMVMGKSYYVLSVGDDNDVITLLDSASEVSLSEGDTKTVQASGQTYEVSIDYIGETTVSLKVNGEITDALTAGATTKLDDGSYVGVREIRYNSKDTGISSAIFSIGKGKLILSDGDEIEINDDAVTGLTATITNATNELRQIGIQWAADDDIFITPDSEAVMPAFEAVKLSFTGIEYPSTRETITVEKGSDDYITLSDFPLKGGVKEDIDILFTNGTDYSIIGKDATHQLATGTTTITFDGDDDAYFIASYNDGDEAESYLMKATGFKIEDDVNKTDIQYFTSSGWADAQEEAENGDTVDVGNVEMTVGQIDKVGKSVVLTNASANVNFNTLYSERGMKIFLPHNVAAASTTPGFINFSAASASFQLQFYEEDEDQNIAGGDHFNVTLSLNTDGDVTASAVVGEDVSFEEIGSTDVFRSFMYSALATEILHDQSGDQESVEVMYNGEEVSANVYLTAADVTSSSDSETGIKTAKDTETSVYSGMNIVVVGGSAINSVAADLLGGAYRGEMFTQMTTVGAGEFLIQSFAHGGKTALLVAGYNAADTSKAVDYLVNNEAKVDTKVGNKYKGSSATEATLVVA